MSTALAAFLAIATALLAGEVMWLPLAGFACGAGIAGLYLLRGWRAERLGPGNTLTLVRMALAMLLLAPLSLPELASGGTGWFIFSLAVLTLALDGLDGPLARDSGLAGPWGARFDMEVDAVFALLLAAVAWRAGAAGPWILLLGGLRYLFLLAMSALPWLRAPLPERFRRKVVCVIQIGTLAGLLAPIVNPPVSTIAALIALGLLMWSFAVDMIWLAKKA